MKTIIIATFAIGILASPAWAAPRDQSFDDPTFRRCVSWMLDGQRGAMIDNVCLDEYELPPPSLFLCARKVQTGFLSTTDREVCAIIYDEQAKKVRGGYIKKI